jgi:cytochrome c oxidase assembly protein subunit 11
MKRSSNSRTMAMLVGLVICMLGLSFASVPLYRMFCQATGFGGTTQIATSAPGAVADKWIWVRFNADVSPGLDWSFEPEQREMRVHPGEPVLIAYRATNRSGHAVTGTAVHNVTPDIAGLYFDKIECFCFTEQTLQAGETAEMPVTFFIDPDMMKDRNAKDIPSITLSYTFFPAKTQPNDAKVAAVRTVSTASSPSAKESSR